MEEKPVRVLGLKTESFLDVWVGSFKILEKKCSSPPTVPLIFVFNEQLEELKTISSKLVGGF